MEFIITESDEIQVLQVPNCCRSHPGIASDCNQRNVATAQEHFIALQPPRATVWGETHFGIMPDWNPAEVIGTKPHRLALSLYRDLVTEDVWATQRTEYGYTDVRPHPLMVTFMGHPYIDIRASFNSFLPDGVDRDIGERLIQHYFQTLKDSPQSHDKVEFDILFTCWTFDFDAQAERLRRGGFRENEISELETALQSLARVSRLEDLNNIKTLSEMQKALIDRGDGRSIRRYSL